MLDDDFPCACGIGAVSVSRVSAGDLGRHSAGDMRLAVRQREKKKECAFCVFTIPFGLNVEWKRGGGIGRRCEPCRVKKAEEWDSHVPDSVGLRKMQNLRWDFVQNVIISPRDPCSSKGGAGGVSMPLPNWSRQLWRHQRRSHFPANPDGAVRGLTPETPCCKREGGEGGGWN